LDVYEVTVGRFRAFVQAGLGTQANAPPDGAGAHPLIPTSGWSGAWNAHLPVDSAALRTALICDATYATWTDQPDNNEALPIACASWYEAFAFCAWDQGRLPTEAEWNYAAAGGDEQRVYPWSSPPSSLVIDPSYATYDCLGDGSDAGACAPADVLRVGAKSPKGDARWGHADLAGSTWEWVLDVYADPYPSSSCSDCANLVTGPTRVVRGGGAGVQPQFLVTSYRWGTDLPTDHFAGNGLRCARNP
jgi:formylglycine-generating enzyme required for sulfatase activity